MGRRTWGQWDTLEVECSEKGCTAMAVGQDMFDADLCDMHLDEALEMEEADHMVKWIKENA